MNLQASKLFIPPYNNEAERAVLSCFLQSTAKLDEHYPSLPTDAFWKSQHRVIFQAMVNRRNEDEGVDLASLTIFLKELGLLDEAGGIPYLSNAIHEAVPSAEMCEYYLATVMNLYRQRLVLELCTQTAHKIVEKEVGEKDDCVQFLHNFAADSEKLALGIKTNIEIDVGELAAQRVKLYDDLRMGRIVKQPSLSWGLEFADEKGAIQNFDVSFGRMEKGSVIAIGALPSHGKTVVGLEICRANFNAGESVAIATLDMPASKTMDRLLCVEADIDIMAAVNGRLDDDAQKRVSLRAEMLEADKSRLHLIGGIRTAHELRNWASQIKRRHGLSLLCIDHLTRIAPHKNFKDRRERFTETAEIVKMIAKELDVVVLLLCQLNRDAAKNETMPSIHQFYETGAIEQEVTTAIMLFRAEKHADGWMEWDLQKNQNGQTGNGKWWFKKTTMRLTNYEKPTFD